MRVGVAIEETWAFFNEVYADFVEHHEVSVYQPRVYRWPFLNTRINRYLSNRDWIQFMRNNQVVFFEWASALLDTASHFPKTCGIVTRLHRYEMNQWVERINWDVVDKIILVSHAKQEEFSARFPSQAGKVVVIPEAISFDRFFSKPKVFNGNIGILCNLTPRKRVYELILAFHELLHVDQGFHLHIGGGRHLAFVDYYDALHHLVKGLNLQDKVTFYGNVTDQLEWYHRVDIFISNSYSEGLQVSPMEAISSGCYCLSHRWQGAEELLPEDSLFYTERELNLKILTYAGLSQAEKSEKIAVLQEFVQQRFDINRIKTQIRQVVEEAGKAYFAAGSSR